MRVVVLNQTYHPDVAATAQLMWDWSRYLEAAGHRVTAITSRRIYGARGEFERAYERHGGIEIHRVTQTGFGKAAGLRGRMSDFLSFYVSAWLKLQELPPPDVIVALTSPPMIALEGLGQKLLRRRADGRSVRLVYYCMDLYPDAAMAMGYMRPRSPVARLMRRLTRRTLAMSDAVVVLGRDMKQRVQRVYGPLRDGRIHVVPPWAHGSELRPVPRHQVPLAAQLGLQRTFNIVYSGNLGMAHDLETMIGAMETMRNDTDTRFVFIGGGNRFESLKQRGAAAGWAHVSFVPYQDRDMLGQSLNLADVHLVSQLPEFAGIVVPSKLFGIMAVGKPSVMVGPPDVEVSRIIAETGCGIVVPNRAVDQLVAELRRLRADADLRIRLGLRAREAFEAQYDAPVACGRLTQLLERLTGRRQA